MGSERDGNAVLTSGNRPPVQCSPGGRLLRRHTMGIFCKGLHCAGCGKGIPLSIIIIVLAIAAMNSHSFMSALGRALVEIVALIAIAWIATIAIYAIFCRKGPTIVSCRTDRIWYSEQKYMETGNPEWLAFS